MATLNFDATSRRAKAGRTLPLAGALLALQQTPDARLQVFPRCAHWAQREHQEEPDRLVLDFLRKR